MSGYMTSLAPGTALAVAMPPLGFTSGSTEAVDHERGHPYVAKARRAIGAGEDPERLAGRALGSVAAVVGLLAEPAGVLGVEVGTGDDPTTGHAGLDRVVGGFAISRAM